MSTSVVRESEKYPKEYLARLPAIKASLAEDSEIISIIHELKKRDVMESNGLAAFRAHSLMASKPYPVWYYTGRVKRYIRRFFPDKECV
jgi:hypothetical protein